MEPGKLIRLRQFCDPQNRTFLVAIDQTIPRGLHPALADPLKVIEGLASSDCDALLLHSGLVKLAAARLAGKKPFLLKLTTTTTGSQDKTQRILVDSVERAVYLGAVGVAINVFIGSSFEVSMLAQFNQASQLCDRWGMPLIAMINPMPEYEFDPERLAYVCRVGAELGADLVKTDYPGSPEKFRYVIDNCPVPVLVEESPHPEDEQGTLQTVGEVMEAGGAGVMFGGRVWAHLDPAQISRRISVLVHS